MYVEYESCTLKLWHLCIGISNYILTAAIAPFAAQLSRKAIRAQLVLRGVQPTFMYRDDLNALQKEFDEEKLVHLRMRKHNRRKGNAYVHEVS